MEPDEREDETFEILHQVIECAKTLWILGVVDVDQRTDFGRGEGNVLIPANDLQFLIEEKETEGNGHLNCDCDNVNQNNFHSTNNSVIRMYYSIVLF